MKTTPKILVSIALILQTFVWITPVFAQQSGLTAQQVIERIQKQVGLTWGNETVDTFKAGNPNTKVTGVAVTMMATLDVLQKAVAANCNLIVTHEPTFYGHLDETKALEETNDPIYAAKAAFIKEHNLIIWRFHDYWHRRDPDGVRVGMMKALGWEKYQKNVGDDVFEIPETSLKKLAAEVEKKLDIHTMRVVGNPDIKVTKLALAPGFPGFEYQRQLLARDDVEVLVMGEAHEWETILYGADAVAAGMKKALVIMGHIPSEQAGMDECASWMQSFLTEVPVKFIPALEPFWTP